MRTEPFVILGDTARRAGESDTVYRDRLCEMLNPGATYTAEDLGDATDLDAFAQSDLFLSNVKGAA